MHQDRNNGPWPELKAKRHNKFHDTPLDSLNVVHSHLDGESHDIQKVKKDKAVKRLNRAQNMFKEMTDYADKLDTA